MSRESAFEVVVRWRAHDGAEYRLVARRRSHDNFGRLPPKEYAIEELHGDLLGGESWQEKTPSSEWRNESVQRDLSFIDLAYQAGRKEGAK